MNWKIALGLFLIIASLSEMLSIIRDYSSEKLDFWPFGVEIGFLAMMALAIYLIRNGQKEKTLR